MKQKILAMFLILTIVTVFNFSIVQATTGDANFYSDNDNIVIENDIVTISLKAGNIKEITANLDIQSSSLEYEGIEGKDGWNGEYNSSTKEIKLTSSSESNITEEKEIAILKLKILDNAFEKGTVEISEIEIKKADNTFEDLADIDIYIENSDNELDDDNETDIYEGTDDDDLQETIVQGQSSDDYTETTGDLGDFELDTEDDEEDGDEEDGDEEDGDEEDGDEEDGDEEDGDEEDGDEEDGDEEDGDVEDGDEEDGDEKDEDDKKANTVTPSKEDEGSKGVVQDENKATSRIPQTGEVFSGIVIIAIVCAGIISIVLYKKMKKNNY